MESRQGSKIRTPRLCHVRIALTGANAKAIGITQGALRGGPVSVREAARRAGAGRKSGARRCDRVANGGVLDRTDDGLIVFPLRP